MPAFEDIFAKAVTVDGVHMDVVLPVNRGDSFMSLIEKHNTCHDPETGQFCSGSSAQGRAKAFRAMSKDFKSVFLANQEKRQKAFRPHSLGSIHVGMNGTVRAQESDAVLVKKANVRAVTEKANLDAFELDGFTTSIFLDSIRSEKKAGITREDFSRLGFTVRNHSRVKEVIKAELPDMDIDEALDALARHYDLAAKLSRKRENEETFSSRDPDFLEMVKLSGVASKIETAMESGPLGIPGKRHFRRLFLTNYGLNYSETADNMAALMRGQVPESLPTDKQVMTAGIYRGLQDAWAASSSDPKSLALMHGVKDALGLEVEINSVPERMTEAKKIYDRNPDLYQEIARAVYASTQEKLTELDINEMVLFRGLSITPETASKENLEVLKRRTTAKHKIEGPGKTVIAEDELALNPLSSFSMDYATTLHFSAQNAPHEGYAMTIVAKVPKEKIFCLATTGPGCLTEAEVLVLGHDPKALTLTADEGGYLTDGDSMDLLDKIGFSLFDDSEDSGEFWNNAWDHEFSSGSDSLLSLIEKHNTCHDPKDGRFCSGGASGRVSALARGIAENFYSEAKAVTRHFERAIGAAVHRDGSVEAYQHERSAVKAKNVDDISAIMNHEKFSGRNIGLELHSYTLEATREELSKHPTPHSLARAKSNILMAEDVTGFLEEHFESDDQGLDELAEMAELWDRKEKEYNEGTLDRNSESTKRWLETSNLYGEFESMVARHMTPHPSKGLPDQMRHEMVAVKRAVLSDKKIFAQFLRGQYDFAMSEGEVRARGTIRAIQNAWAESSSSPLSLAVMMAAKDELGLDVDLKSVPDQVMQAESLYKSSGDALREAARAIYENTQAKLKEDGVEEMVVFRGLKIRRRDPLHAEAVELMDKRFKGDRNGPNGTMVTEDEIALNPLSSFSRDAMVSLRFSDDHGWPEQVSEETPTDVWSLMVVASVPRKKIFSTAATGPGCLVESEVIVLGHDPKAIVVTADNKSSHDRAHSPDFLKRVSGALDPELVDFWAQRSKEFWDPDWDSEFPSD